MAAKKYPAIRSRSVELDGIRYVIVRESVFHWLCQQAGVNQAAPTVKDTVAVDAIDVDGATLAEKLVRRRQSVGLSQAELARRAGVRPETLNRIERGRTTPDFATVRKLVTAMAAAERESLQPSRKECTDDR